MKHQFLRILAATVTAAVLLALPALAADKKSNADNVVTVYVSAHGGSSMAKEVNEMHIAMEAKGWRFADMEVHTENADTEGMWITYVR